MTRIPAQPQFPRRACGSMQQRRMPQRLQASGGSKRMATRPSRIRSAIRSVTTTDSKTQRTPKRSETASARFAESYSVIVDLVLSVRSHWPAMLRESCSPSHRSHTQRPTWSPDFAAGRALPTPHLTESSDFSALASTGGIAWAPLLKGAGLPASCRQPRPPLSPAAVGSAPWPRPAPGHRVGHTSGK